MEYPTTYNSHGLASWSNVLIRVGEIQFEVIAKNPDLLT